MRSENKEREQEIILKSGEFHSSVVEVSVQCMFFSICVVHNIHTFAIVSSFFKGG